MNLESKKMNRVIFLLENHKKFKSIVDYRPELFVYINHMKEIVRALEYDFEQNTEKWITAFTLQFGAENGDFSSTEKNDVHLQDDDMVRKLVGKLKRYGAKFKNEKNLYNRPDEEFTENRSDFAEGVADMIAEEIIATDTGVDSWFFNKKAVHNIVADVLLGSYKDQWQYDGGWFTENGEMVRVTKADYMCEGKHILGEVLELYRKAVREFAHRTDGIQEMKDSIKKINIDAEYYNLPKIKDIYVTNTKVTFDSEKCFVHDRVIRGASGDRVTEISSLLDVPISGLANDTVAWQSEGLYRHRY